MFFMGFWFDMFLWVFVLSRASCFLSSGDNGNRLAGSGKVGGHVALKVEVSELLALLELEQGLQLGIGVDATAVLLVLQVVVADVGVDLASDLGPGHLRAVGLSEKIGQLLGDEGGLHKTRGSTVADLAALLGAGLLSSANLTDRVALKGAKLGAKSGGKCNNLLQLGSDGSKLRSNGGLNGRNNGGVGGRSVGGSGNNGSGFNRSSRGLGSLGLLGSLHDLGRGSSSSGSGRSRSRGGGGGRGSGSSGRSGSGRRSGGLCRLSHLVGWFIPSIEMSF